MSSLAEEATGSVLAGRPVRASGHQAAPLAACQGPGFTFGSFVGLQEFGLGLSVAILLDATVVRAILMLAVMKLLGDWNWYLPARLRRVLRVPAEPVPGT
jgi:RND superfamily putative drug exporter